MRRSTAARSTIRTHSGASRRSGSTGSARPERIANWSFDPVEIKWYEDGILNLCFNCVDRHLPERADDVALIWEGDEPGVTKRLTFGELHAETVRMANCLKAMGVAKGDRVTLYMPMILKAAVAMLACARIGAIHSVVFGGFSPQGPSRKDRGLRQPVCHPRSVWW